jgi:hypothetical protein
MGPGIDSNTFAGRAKPRLTLRTTFDTSCPVNHYAEPVGLAPGGGIEGFANPLGKGFARGFSGGFPSIPLAIGAIEAMSSERLVRNWLPPATRTKPPWPLGFFRMFFHRGRVFRLQMEMCGCSLIFLKANQTDAKAVTTKIGWQSSQACHRLPSAKESQGENFPLLP